MTDNCESQAQSTLPGGIILAEMLKDIGQKFSTDALTCIAYHELGVAINTPKLNLDLTSRRCEFDCIRQ